MEPYQEISTELAPLLNALSHPARLEILLHLSKYQGCQAGSISDRLPLAKSTVSEHLNRLKEVNLIQCSPYGVCQHYIINFDTLSFLKENMNVFFRGVDVARKNSILCNERDIVNGPE